MQQTLRYMTKLDRAINNQAKLIKLDAIYQSHNITPIDLVHILKEVNELLI